jgi:hypothetical protein
VQRVDQSLLRGGRNCISQAKQELQVEDTTQSGGLLREKSKFRPLGSFLAGCGYQHQDRLGEERGNDTEDFGGMIDRDDEL